jgi:hypothetical protein
MADFDTPPFGFAWYSSTPGVYAACAVPLDREECTYEIHEYREQIHRMWTYVAVQFASSMRGRIVGYARNRSRQYPGRLA